LDIDFTKIHSPTDLAIAVQLQKYVNLLYLGWINCVVLDLTTGGDATESRPMVRGRNRLKPVSNNILRLGPLKNLWTGVYRSWTLPLYLGHVQSLIFSGEVSTLLFAGRFKLEIKLQMSAGISDKLGIVGFVLEVAA